MSVKISKRASFIVLWLCKKKNLYIIFPLDVVCRQRTNMFTGTLGKHHQMRESRCCSTLPHTYIHIIHSSYTYVYTAQCIEGREEKNNKKRPEKPSVYFNLSQEELSLYIMNGKPHFVR